MLQFAFEYAIFEYMIRRALVLIWSGSVNEELCVYRSYRPCIRCSIWVWMGGVRLL